MALPGPHEAVQTLEEGQRSLDALVGRLSHDDLIRSATIGGGDWSAQDLIGHIATWQGIALEALEEWRRGSKPWVEREVFAVEGAVDRLNDEAVPRKRGRSLDEVRAEAADIHSKLISEIGSMDPEEWRGKAFYPAARRTTLGTLLGSITGAPRRPFGHAFAHLPDLEAFAATLK